MPELISTCTSSVDITTQRLSQLSFCLPSPGSQNIHQNNSSDKSKLLLSPVELHPDVWKLERSILAKSRELRQFDNFDLLDSQGFEASLGRAKFVDYIWTPNRIDSDEREIIKAFGIDQEEELKSKLKKSSIRNKPKRHDTLRSTSKPTSKNAKHKKTGTALISKYF